MGRQVKCPICKVSLDKDDSVTHGKRYYHPKCHAAWQNEGNEYKDLMTYISELHNIEYPSMIIKKQVKDLKVDGYRYKGMELALRYFYETLDNRVREGDGVGIIPYVYEEAKNHYIMMRRIEKSVKDIVGEKSKIVHVSSPNSTYIKKSKKIDIGTL